VQGLYGSLVWQAKAHFAAAAGHPGRWLHRVARPQPQLYAVVEHEQGKGGVQFKRRAIQQAAIKVGTGGRAVDVEQEVMGDGGHAGSLEMGGQVRPV